MELFDNWFFSLIQLISLVLQINIDGSSWVLEERKTLLITLEKVDQMSWWTYLIEGDPPLNTHKIVPETSRLSDLDTEARATVCFKLLNSKYS